MGAPVPKDQRLGIHLSTRVTSAVKGKGKDKWDHEEYFVSKLMTPRENCSAVITTSQPQSLRQVIAEDQMGSSNLKG